MQQICNWLSIESFCRRVKNFWTHIFGKNLAWSANFCRVFTNFFVCSSVSATSCSAANRQFTGQTQRTNFHNKNKYRRICIATIWLFHWYTFKCIIVELLSHEFIIFVDLYQQWHFNVHSPDVRCLSTTHWQNSKMKDASTVTSLISCSMNRTFRNVADVDHPVYGKTPDNVNQCPVCKNRLKFVVY